MTSNRIIFTSFIMLVIVVISNGCRYKEPHLKSTWRDREITVEGKSDEWQDCDQYYDEDTRTLVGLLNDESHLYVLLSIHDRRIKKQVLGLGLTVWFDPEGGKEKTFGIRFPVGIPRHMRSSMKAAPNGEDSDLLQKMLESSKMELQILGPEEYEQKTMMLTDVGKYGIDVKMGRTGRNLVYELKIPLTQKRQIRYAVRTDMAKKIGVGFETGKPDQEKMKERPGKRGGGSDGKGGGRGGMGRRPQGGMDGGEQPEGMDGSHGGKMPEPFELWTSVQLAKIYKNLNKGG